MGMPIPSTLRDQRHGHSALRDLPGHAGPLMMGERDPDSEFMALANELRASVKTAPEQAGRANDWSDS